MSPLKIAVVHPLFGWGGTEAVCSWVLYALQDTYDVTLLTFDFGVTLERLNQFYGTSIDPQKVKVFRVKLPPLIGNDMARLAVLRQHYMMKVCKKFTDYFDIFFSTYNEMDFGKRGIQYVHFPFLVDYSYSKLKEETYSKIWYHKPNLVRKVYEKIGHRISNFDRAMLLDNLTIVNSEWTASIFERAYKVKPRVVYPPVFISRFDLSKYYLDPESRENGFVALGRIEPTKRLLEVIEIIERVRDSGIRVHLHIVGKVGDAEYYDKIVRLSRLHSDWLFFETELTREQLIQLLGSHKYGIHGKINEHFGIAVAEMARLGVLPFVHNSGGQVEIVCMEELKYNDISDAVQRIGYVLRNPFLEKDLRTKLMEKAHNFSEIAFSSEVKRIVDNFYL